MQPPSADPFSTPRVIVVAGSIEGLEALARLVHQLPSTFPVPIVVHLHGPRGSPIRRLTRIGSRSASRLNVVFARDGEVLSPGFVYVIPVGDPLVFIAADVMGRASHARASNVDDLFASAARWYGSEVIGVVLSGLGADGTQGLQAITRVDGIRVVQSPFDATFPGMPASALIGDNVQFAVMLDQMGTLLTALVTDPESVKATTPDVQAELTRQVLTVAQTLTKSLDRSIEDVLRVARDNLVMDIVLVTRQRGDRIVITHSTPGPAEMRMQGMSYPKHHSLCQRVLEGRLPAVMPDVEALRSSHDLPVLSLAVGAFMATPVWLSNGTLYGMLCCFNAAVSRELDQRHYLRLQLSARQIARIVNETGDG
jgi:hypothetical protein